MRLLEENYSLSELSEKVSKSSVVYLITCFLFKCIYIPLKALVDNSSDPF